MISPSCRLTYHLHCLGWALTDRGREFPSFPLSFVLPQPLCLCFSLTCTLFFTSILSVSISLAPLLQHKKSADLCCPKV